MTYLVLARKWRPRSFDTLIGQDHVVRALTHALTTQRLHHAWLFTGTRGVGKTTLSRLLAKSLNCETGITATPCGVCRACTEIDTGRFVDYVELDAASNRGVDEMTQLLEQAVYSPSSGRFKVYMIDEVHMLTGHAFNAMLKTLEEPPPHVKFILATTDPQKIPVTVLSRCLQFNLKQMTAESIVAHLQMVLAQEELAFETPALRLIAQAASGSMRDALSLTDQAIAYSAGDLTTEAIQGMLGTIDQRYLVRLLLALSQGSASEVLDVADELATRGLSYSGALADLAILLSRVAIEQRLPGTVSADDPVAQDLVSLGQSLHPDLVQLFYSVAVHSRNELSLAPDEYAGFVMACLRMLALAPEPADGASVLPPVAVVAAPASAGAAVAAAPAVVVHAAPITAAPTAAVASVAPVSATRQPAAAPVATTPQQTAPAQAPHVPVAAPAPAPVAAAAPVASPPASQEIPAWEDVPVEDGMGNFEPDYEPASPKSGSHSGSGAAPSDDVAIEPPQFVADADDQFESPPPSDDDDALGLSAQASDEAAAPVFASSRKKIKSPKLRDMTAKAWPILAAQLPLTGLAAQLALQSEWLGVKNDEVNLRVAVRTLAESPGQSRLCTLLCEHFGAVVRLNVEYGATGDETAHAVEQADRAVRQERAEEAAQVDPFVQTLISEFGARIVPGSVRAAPVNKAA